MQGSLNKQKGMTAIGWIILVCIIGFNGLVAINVAPVYFTDSSIKTMWEKLETDSALRGLKPKRLRKLILKRLKINNVYGVDSKAITVSKIKSGYLVGYVYEERGKIVGSLDYIVTFKHEAKVPAK